MKINSNERTDNDKHTIVEAFTYCQTSTSKCRRKKKSFFISEMTRIFLLVIIRIEIY